MTNCTILMFPNVDCFIGVKYEFSVEKSPYTPPSLFSLVRSCAFKFGDEVLETMMVQYIDMRLGFWVIPGHFCVLEFSTGC
jgi:hypothetical protein